VVSARLQRCRWSRRGQTIAVVGARLDLLTTTRFQMIAVVDARLDLQSMPSFQMTMCTKRQINGRLHVAR